MAKKKIEKPNYWATIYYEGEGIAPQSTRECGDEVKKRIDDYYTWTYSSGWMDLWKRLYVADNANWYTGGNTLETGESSEFRSMKINHFTNLLDHVQTLSITDRPAWKPIATNSDAKSQEQTIIAEGILDYMMREKRVERHLRDATRNALLFTEGYVSVQWDPDTGEVTAQDGGKSGKAGDLKYGSHEPVDVIRDPRLNKFYDRSYLVVRTYPNKWDLAAKYPDYEDEIINTDDGVTARNHYLIGTERMGTFNSDQVELYTFFHEKSAACPEGRQMTMLKDGTVLTDSILLYEHIPVYRIVPRDMIGQPMGRSVSLDLLPLQEMVDAHWSTILTINEQYGISNIMLPVGSNIDSDSIGGLRTIVYNPQGGGKPEVMQMPQVPASIGSTISQLVQEMQTLSGVNDVSRGVPPPSLESGSALALVQSMAVQFQAPLQQSYVNLLEDVGTATIQILKNYADDERMIQISGNKKRGMIKQAFDKNDLTTISRVQVQSGNAMSKTTAGKVALAESLIKNKMIDSPREYLMVIETGSLDPLVEGPTTELLNLATENELLMDGESVPVMFTDDHRTHIMEHKAMVSDPMVRRDPNKLQVINAHIMEHMQMLTSPEYQQFNQLMGQPNLNQQPQQPGGAPGQPGQRPPGLPNGAPPQGVMLPNGATPASSGAAQEKANGINMPNSPVNKLTGERPNLAGPV